MGGQRGLYLLAIERIAPTSNPSVGNALILRSSSLVSRATFKYKVNKSVVQNSHALKGKALVCTKPYYI